VFVWNYIEVRTRIAHVSAWTCYLNFTTHAIIPASVTDLRVWQVHFRAAITLHVALPPLTFLSSTSAAAAAAAAILSGQLCGGVHLEPQQGLHRQLAAADH
jgi:hypothetical protein